MTSKYKKLVTNNSVITTEVQLPIYEKNGTNEKFNIRSIIAPTKTAFKKLLSKLLPNNICTAGTLMPIKNGTKAINFKLKIALLK